MPESGRPAWAEPLPAHTAVCRCLRCTIASAVVLLETGRPGMALDVLRPIPRDMGDLELVKADLVALGEKAGSLRLANYAANEELSRLEGQIAERRRTLARLARPDPGPKPLRPHERLAAALADGTVTAEGMAAVLGVRPSDLARIAAGRVTLSTTAWRKLMAELERAERQRTGGRA